MESAPEEYLREKGVYDMIDKSIDALMKERPTNAKEWLSEYLLSGGEKKLHNAANYLSREGISPLINDAVLEMIRVRPDHPQQWLGEYIREQSSTPPPPCYPDGKPITPITPSTPSTKKTVTFDLSIVSVESEGIDDDEQEQEEEEQELVRGNSFPGDWMSRMQRYVLRGAASADVHATPDGEVCGRKREYDGISVDKEEDGWLRIAEGSGWVRRTPQWTPSGTEAGVVQRRVEIPGGYTVGQQVQGTGQERRGEVVGKGADGTTVKVRWADGEETDEALAAIELVLTDTPGLTKRPTMLWTAHSLLPPSEGKGYTIVFDLDETLIYARRGPVHCRQGVQEMLRGLDREGVEVVVWTAGMRGYAQTILESIDKGKVVKHLVYRNPAWHTSSQRKDLSYLNRPLDRLIIIENTIDAMAGYPDNAILVPDFEGDRDLVIPTLSRCLQAMLLQQQPVPDFLASSPLLSRSEATDANGTAFSVYRLVVGNPAPSLTAHAMG